MTWAACSFSSSVTLNHTYMVEVNREDLWADVLAYNNFKQYLENTFPVLFLKYLTYRNKGIWSGQENLVVLTASKPDAPSECTRRVMYMNVPW